MYTLLLFHYTGSPMTGSWQRLFLATHRKRNVSQVFIKKMQSNFLLCYLLKNLITLLLQYCLTKAQKFACQLFTIYFVDFESYFNIHLNSCRVIATRSSGWSLTTQMACPDKLAVNLLVNHNSYCMASTWELLKNNIASLTTASMSVSNLNMQTCLQLSCLLSILFIYLSSYSYALISFNHSNTTLLPWQTNVYLSINIASK